VYVCTHVHVSICANACVCVCLFVFVHLLYRSRKVSKNKIFTLISWH